MNNKNFPKGKKARYWGIGLVGVVIVAFVFLSLNSAQASGAPAIATAKVTTLNVAQTIESSGSLAAQPSAGLTWNTNGVVETVNVRAGDKVKAGDVLMKLKTTSVSPSIISAQSDLITAQQALKTAQSSTSLAQAVIDLKNAQEAYDKAANYLQYLQNSQTVPQTQTLVSLERRGQAWRYVYKTKSFKGPAPTDWIVNAQNDLALKKGQLQDAQNTYDRLKAGLNSPDVIAAQAKVDAAQATVDSMSIIASFDGEVLFVANQPGDVVSTGATAVNVANLDRLYVDTQVDESDIASIKVGNPVSATLDAAPGLTLTGKVTTINPVGQAISGLVKYTVRVDLDKADKDLSLPLGATVNATIQVKEPTATLAVPVTAIQNDSRGEYVWVVRNGSPRRVNVVGGQIVGDLVAVTGNLREGESVQLGQVNNNNLSNRGPFRFFGGGRGG
jgi:RND family efflux transporter MFP subunit